MADVRRWLAEELGIRLMRAVFVDGKHELLEPSEYLVLHFLYKHQGKSLSMTEIEKGLKEISYSSVANAIKALEKMEYERLLIPVLADSFSEMREPRSLIESTMEITRKGTTRRCRITSWGVRFMRESEAMDREIHDKLFADELKRLREDDAEKYNIALEKLALEESLSNGEKRVITELKKEKRE